MLITLFLITLVVFAILSFSPLDPAELAIRGSQGEGQGTQSAQEDVADAIREYRAFLNLDKPRFLNLDVEDKPKLVKRTFPQLLQPIPQKTDENTKELMEKLSKAKEDLKGMGSNCFRELAEFLSKHDLEAFENLLVPLAETFVPKDLWDKGGFNNISHSKLKAFLEAVQQVVLLRERLKSYSEVDEKEIKKLKEKVNLAKNLFLSWWKGEKEKFDINRVKALAQKFAQASPKEREKIGKELVYLKKVTIPFLIPYVLKPQEFKKDPHDQEDLRLQTIDILIQIMPDVRYSYKKTDPPSVKKEAILYWKYWWERNDKYFLTLSKKEKFLRAFTHTQYATWMSRLIHLDLGKSWYHKKPVLDVILERIPISLQLALPSFLLVYLLAIPLGVFSATHRDSLSDRLITLFLFILYSLPSFWIALLLIQNFTSGTFGFFPTGQLSSTGFDKLPWWQKILDRLHHLALPILCMTYGGLAYISRQMRAAVLESINQDYIRTARAKGLKGTLVIWKHVFWNSTIPILTLLAGLFPVLMGGSVIIEYIFSIQGMGLASFEAVMQKDRPMVMAIMFFYALLVLIGILVVDILYAFVDPRITYD